jgi:hypothetical protein
MTLRSRSNGAGAWAQRVGQAISRAASHPHAPWAIAGFWFVLTFTVTLWVWGLNPLIMMSPDEAVNRFGASLIRRIWPTPAIGLRSEITPSRLTRR